MPLRFREDLPVHDLFRHHLREPFHLGLPANHLGLVLSDVRLRFGQLGDGRLNVALGHGDQLLRLLDQPLVQLDLRHLPLVLFVQFGNENVRQQLALLDLLADVHVKVPDEARDLRKNRGLLIGVDESGLIDRVVDGAPLPA